MVRGYNRVPYVKPQTDTRRIHFVQSDFRTPLKSSPDTTTRVSNTESQPNHKSGIALQQTRRAGRTQQPAEKMRTNEMPPAGFFEYFQNSANFSEISCQTNRSAYAEYGVGRNAKDQFIPLNALSHSIHLIGGRLVFECRFKNKRMVHAPRILI
jgi:hypothetical protein